LRIDRTTMVSLIDALERAGYVKRTEPNDRRAYLTTLTAAGRKVQARAEKAVEADALGLFGQLTGAEQKELDRLLGRLIGRSERGLQ
jgi:DNA-binding MarR family transcriptional regulator